MECRISSLLHLYLMISRKYILLIKNILLAKCMFELPNIVVNSMFTFLAVHDKMWWKKWKLLPDFCPRAIYPLYMYSEHSLLQSCCLGHLAPLCSNQKRANSPHWTQAPRFLRNGDLLCPAKTLFSEMRILFCLFRLLLTYSLPQSWSQLNENRLVCRISWFTRSGLLQNLYRKLQ